MERAAGAEAPRSCSTSVSAATDTGGSNRTATQSFRVTVLQPFTDDPIVPGETPVRTVHFTELRTRIDGLRAAAGLGRGSRGRTRSCGRG